MSYRARDVVSILAAAAAIWGFGAGCKRDAGQASLGDDPGSTPAVACVDRDRDGYGIGCPLGVDCDDADPRVTDGCYRCLHDAPGCPCSSEGARAACGKIIARVGEQTTCGFGGTTCKAGRWGDCVLDGRSAAPAPSSSLSPLGIAPPTPCAEKCDPYCNHFPDTPDDSLSRGSLVGTDAGLTIRPIDGGVRPVHPNGPMPPSVTSALVDAGLYPDAGADAIVYHELPPLATAEDDVHATATTKAVDVYFLTDTSGGSLYANAALDEAVNGPNGVREQVVRALPDARFGAGHYEQYDQLPWNHESRPTIAYEHVLSMTASATDLADAWTWLEGRVVSSIPSPRSWAAALFAEATGLGLHRGARPPWVLPRSVFSSPVTSEAGPCGGGAIGYPCFRSDALPITVLLAESPANNGPGGQFAYARDPEHIVDGAATWAGVPVLQVADNGTEATAFPIDPALKFATYAGTTDGVFPSGSTRMSWRWDTPSTGDTGDPPAVRATGCAPGWFAASPNVYFTFTVSERTWFHFDTVGSAYAPRDPDYGTALYLYESTPAATVGIACNVAAFFGDPGHPNVSSIDGVVDPGTYFLVVDGIYGSLGNYVLHVGAMPDGSARAAPSYEEAEGAYAALGGRVVGVDTSGNGCEGGFAEFVQSLTRGALEKLATDTGSVDPVAGSPLVVPLTSYGDPCSSGDPPARDQIASAITAAASSRMNVSAVAIDADDAFDFDGPGGAVTLTPNAIDDASFVQSIRAVPTPDALTGCKSVQGARFSGCRPGTKLSFSVVFKTPPAVSPAPHDQIFSFVIRTLRDDAIVLGETPVILVVPATAGRYGDAFFVRDYDTSGVCPAGSPPLWSLFSWDAFTPAGSRIDLDVAVAASVADLDAAPSDPLLFSAMPGPAALAGEPIGIARRAPAGPDTEQGGTVVDETLRRAMRQRQSRALRLRAHLRPSADGLVAPVLRLWNQQISCQPAE